jgi:hypothetical protein
MAEEKENFTGIGLPYQLSADARARGAQRPYSRNNQ